MREILQALLASRATKLAVIAVVLVVAAWFVRSAWLLGAAADGCAESLVTAIEKKDGAYVERVVRSPAIRTKLLSGRPVELGFVRPLSDEWTRVGLFVRSATATENVTLQLQTQDGCLFLRDFER